MAGNDDLSTILAAPSGDSPPYAQGVIKQWDPDTFESIVTVHGQDLENLPVKSSVEALTYQEGDTVILARWSGSTGAPETWWIDGRAVIPGTGRGEDAIAFMTTALGSAVARAVIGSSIFIDTVLTDGRRDAFDSFGDIFLGTNATLGPEVNFTLTGTQLFCIWGAEVDTNVVATSGVGRNVDAYMALDIQGPSNVSPSENFSARMHLDDGGADARIVQPSVAAGRRLGGLTPGDYTVTAQYQIVQNGDNQLSQAQWSSRWLIVFAF